MNQELLKAIIYLLVGISVLLTGMKLMSVGLKKAVGSKLKNFFKKTQNSPFISMGIGLLVTCVIQASDATSAMVIGFINAGVMSMYQGLSIMLGAYIGTTITGVLASFSSLSISVYLLLFAFIGTILMFFKKEKLQYIGEILCGLGLLFFGLAVMKDAFKNADIRSFCETMFSSIEFGGLLFLIGVIIAAVIQSSSAVTSIVIAMVGGGALDLASGLYIALGATLGTVANTLIASMTGNIKGKRVAVIAFTLRAITSIAMLIILLIFENQIASLMHTFAINGSDELPIAMFTVFYNLIFMPLLLPLLKPFIKLFNKIMVDKNQNALDKTIHFIDDKLLITPPIALMQVKKEIIHMYTLAFKNYQNSISKMVENTNDYDKLIVDTEDKVDYLNKRITDFLIKLSNKLTNKDEKVVGAYFHVVNDIERIGDHAYNFYEMDNEMKSKDLQFSEYAIKEIKEMDAILVPMFNEAKDIFDNLDKSKLKELHDLEEKTDDLKNIFYNNHYERVKNNQCSNELTPYVSSLVTELERIADHLTNVAYSVENPTGDDD